MLHITLSITVIFSNLIIACNGQTGNDVKSVMTQLFTTNGYNKNVRPKNDQLTPTLTYIDLFLVGINGIDEIEQKLTTTGYLSISWTDEFLTWDPTSYGGIGYFYVSQSDIWKPDITLQNGFKKLNELGSSFIHASVGSDGTVAWYPFEVFETKCTIDVTYFPYDRQTCSLVFVVWYSIINDVNVTLGNNGMYLDDVPENGVWSIGSTSASQDGQGSSESRVVFKITLERNSAYYVMNVILPVVFLGILNVFTFLLPADCGEKMGYSITVFLAFAVFLTIVSAELPKTSGSILSSYLLFQIAMGTFVVLVTTFELRLHHRTIPVPSILLRIFARRGKIAVNNMKERNDAHEIIKNWRDIVSKIDFILFWSTLLVEFIGTVAFWAILSTGNT